MINFLNNFYKSKEFKNLTNNPTYFFGESYGGHYIPAFAEALLKNNTELKINFKGVGIGDVFYLNFFLLLGKNLIFLLINLILYKFFIGVDSLIFINAIV